MNCPLYIRYVSIMILILKMLPQQHYWVENTENEAEKAFLAHVHATHCQQNDVSTLLRNLREAGKTL